MTATDGAPSGQLLRSSGVMAVGTVVSRLLGFVRTVAVAGAIGINLLGTSYAVANSVPNIIYILLAGGVLNSVFVPQIVRAMRERSDGGDEYVHRLITLSGLVLLLVTVAATLAAPAVIPLWTHNFGDPELGVATLFAYWCLPQIFFYGLYTILGQVLNARGSFGPMMWAPIVNNVVVIATCGLFLAVRTFDPRSPDAVAHITHGQVVLLGAGTTLGVVLQSLVLLPVVRRSGYRYRPRFDFRGWGLGKAGELAKWTFAFVVVNQLGYLVVTKLSSGVDETATRRHIGEGIGFAAYNNAFLIFQLPHAVVTVSLVTAMLPRMSAALAAGRRGEMVRDFSEGMRISAVATVPAAVAFLVLGPDIGGVIYALSGLGASSGRSVGVILAGFGLGLVAFSSEFIALRGFYAQENTRTPFYLAVVIQVVNVVGVLAARTLPLRWVTTGMAVAYGLAYVVGWALSLVLLKKSLRRIDGPRITRTYVRLGIAAALAGVLAWLSVRALHAGLGYGFGGSITALALGGGVLTVVYVSAARRMRVTELTSMLATVRARVGR